MGTASNLREGRGPRAASSRPRRIAAIDIGSNSIRQILADVWPDGRIQVVDEMKAAPRLLSDLHATKVLDKGPSRAPPRR